MDKTKAYDRFGRALEAGDVVSIPSKLDTLWKVSEVKPIMNPGVPPGMVEISLVAVLVTGAQGGHAIPDVLRVRTAEEVKGPVRVGES